MFEVDLRLYVGIFSGVVYCIDETTQTPVTVPESFVAIDDFITKYIPESSTNDNVTYHAMILFSQYYSTSNSGEPVGELPRLV